MKQGKAWRCGECGTCVYPHEEHNCPALDRRQRENAQLKDIADMEKGTEITEQ